MSGRTLRWLASLLHRPASPATPRLTIVRHHRVYADGEAALYRIGVSASVLEGQLTLLARAGLAPLGVAEALARLADGAPRCVAMTFDDGYADNVERAVPALARHGGRATFYLTSGLIESRTPPWWDVLAHALERTRHERLQWSVGTSRFDLSLAGPEARRHALRALLPALHVTPAEQASRLAELRATLDVRERATCELATWSQAERLVAGGHEVGAHTLSHPFLTLLPRLDQEREIAGSVACIGKRLGVTPRGLAYPGGDHDGTSIAAARAAGLAYAVTTRAGDVTSADAPPFELPRRAWSEGACLGPNGRFSARLARAELDGAFDAARAKRAAAEAST